VYFLLFPGVCTASADTTRARKSQEREGVEYHFITKAAFELDVQNNK
jgi:guanylate kinase